MSPRTRRFLACTLSAAALSAAAGSLARAAEPQAVVEAFHSELSGILSNGESLSPRERYQRLRAAIERAFDLRLMARTASGEAWLTADDTSRQAMIDAYARISAMTYAEQLSGYSGLSFTVNDVRMGPNDSRLVSAHIGASLGSMPLTYVMTQSADNPQDWRISDILLFNAISEMTTRRSEYRSFLKRGGMPDLVSALNDKADQLLAP